MAQELKRAAKSVNTPFKILQAVLMWDLRRIKSNRANWLLAIVVASLFAFVTLSQQNVHQLALRIYRSATDASSTYVTITGTSAWGMSQTLPRLLEVIFGFIVAFIATDMVASDLKRGTDQLLMATSVPTWAYVLGRYLAGLLLCLALALLMLVVICVLATLTSIGGGSRLPVLGPVIGIWFVTVIPSIFLVVGIGFALGTLFPKYTNGVKMLIVAAWVLSSSYFGLFNNVVPSTTSWDPTGAGMSYILAGEYSSAFTDQMHSIGVEDPFSMRGADIADIEVQLAKVTAAVREVENQWSDLFPWLLSRSLYAAIGLGFLVPAMVRFDRFKRAHS